MHTNRGGKTRWVGITYGVTRVVIRSSKLCTFHSLGVAQRTELVLVDPGLHLGRAEASAPAAAPAQQQQQTTGGRAEAEVAPPPGSLVRGAPRTLLRLRQPPAGEEHARPQRDARERLRQGLEAQPGFPGHRLHGQLVVSSPSASFQSSC